MAFIPIALALNVTPGPDMLFCLAQGTGAGPKAGVAASVGVSTGALIHTIIAGMGLAVILSTYPLAFEVLRWLGFAYLLYIALVTILKPSPDEKSTPALANISLFRIWRMGMVVCLLNPKMVLFILALLPQFVDPRLGNVFWQFMAFGLILIIGGTIINAVVGIFAGRLVHRATTNPRFSKMIKWITGGLFVGLAIRLALDETDYSVI